MAIVCSHPPGVTENNSDVPIEIIKLSYDETQFQDVLTIRAKTYGVTLEEAFVKDDELSDHYCAYIQGEPLMAIRATQARKTKIECEEFYPLKFMNTFRETIASTTRFCSLNRQQTLKLGALFMLTSCFDQIKQGMQMDIVNVRKDMQGYYRRLGYLQIAQSDFVHPFWKTLSVVMVSINDLSVPGIFKPLIHWIPEEKRFTLEKLSPYIQFEIPTKNIA